MKTRKSLLLIACAAAAVILISACATKPKFNPNQPQVTMSQAIQAELRQFGPNSDTNPYIEPRTLIRGKLNEFYIVRLALNLSAETQISILAEAKGPDGTETAKAMDMYAFEAYWDSVTYREPDNDAKIQARITNIKRSCIPGFSFTANAGQSIYYIPFVGKNPIPRPSRIYVQVTVGNTEPVIYTADL
ncbi:MAG: hypothetical protein LWX00_04350 [Spirochaetia bacterium]|nr:hypothetical protein [Spirochaetia bacterium]